MTVRNGFRQRSEPCAHLRLYPFLSHVEGERTLFQRANPHSLRLVLSPERGILSVLLCAQLAQCFDGQCFGAAVRASHRRVGQALLLLFQASAQNTLIRPHGYGWTRHEGRTGDARLVMTRPDPKQPRRTPHAGSQEANSMGPGECPGRIPTPREAPGPGRARIGSAECDLYYCVG